MTEEGELQDGRNLKLILGLLVGVFGYVVCIVFRPPVLCYLPELEQWAFSAPPDVIAMRYYGMPQWGIGGFVIGYFLARVGPIADALARPAAARMLARATAAAVCGAMLYIAIEELSHWASLS